VGFTSIFRLPLSKTSRKLRPQINMRDLDNHFGEYVHLAHLNRADDALHTIRKIASCVKPIMRKRGWRVGVLAEFYPNEGNLWGKVFLGYS
jgi:hypothetical protein